jgi:hypothetical protein
MSGAFVQLASSLSGQEAPLECIRPVACIDRGVGRIPANRVHRKMHCKQRWLTYWKSASIDDCALAASIAHRHAFWRLRESIPEVLTHLKPTAALDIGMSWTQIAGYMEEVGAALKAGAPQRAAPVPGPSGRQQPAPDQWPRRRAGHARS